MSTYQERKAIMIENSRKREQEEKERFLNSVGVTRNNVNDIILPSASIIKESEKNYTTYHMTKYPNCFEYSISFQKKDYPFEIYYSKKYFKNQLPTKHQEQFAELMKLFPIEWQE